MLNGLATSELNPDPTAAKFQVPIADLNKLRAACVVSPFEGSSDCSTVRYFSVLELTKNRRRPIMWPKEFLAESTYSSQFSLSNVSTYARLVLAGASAVCFDLAASFWQVLLPSSVNFILQAADGSKWRVDRLPFGVDCASEIMQLIVEELVHLTLQDTQCPLATAVHIDNLIAVGEPHETSQFATAFKRVCATYSVTLNEEVWNTPSSVTQFAGLHLDFQLKGVKLTDRFINSVPAIASLNTFSALESFMGKLLYGAAVLHLPLFRFHFFIKWYRRRLSDLSFGRILWQDKPLLTLRARQALHALHAAVIANDLAKIQPSRVATRCDIPCHPDDLPILVTDATLSGFGAVLYEKGEVVESYGGAFDHIAPSMAVAESAAVVAGLARFAARLRGTTFVLLVDNSTAESAFKRVSARHHAIALAVDTVTRMLIRLNAKVLVARVASGDNVADAPSRGRPLNQACIQATRDAAHLAIDKLALTHTSVGAAVAALASG